MKATWAVFFVLSAAANISAVPAADSDDIANGRTSGSVSHTSKIDDNLVSTL